MSAKVAIITRTRDRTLLLERAIRSVLEQPYSDWIHVIVNDGGDQSSVDALLARYSDAYANRLIVIHHLRSLGMEAASNAGVKASLSEYILIHDDDDTLEPDFLASCTGYLDAPPSSSIDAVASLVTRVNEIIDASGVKTVSKTLYRALGPSISIEEIAEVNPCPPISLLFRRSVLEKIGGFDEQLPVLGDWDFAARLISVSDIGVIQKPLANYHLRPTIGTGAMSNTVHAQIDRHKFYDCLIRNRFARSQDYWRIGQLMQSHGKLAGPRVQLARLYAHPVIGRLIRLWARAVNPNIMSNG